MFGVPILQLQENASAARWQTSINVSISSFFIFCLRLKIMKFRITFFISYFLWHLFGALLHFNIIVTCIFWDSSKLF